VIPESQRQLRWLKKLRMCRGQNQVQPASLAQLTNHFDPTEMGWKI
jgi:hypothetical protein